MLISIARGLPKFLGKLRGERDASPSANALVIKYEKEVHCARSRLAQTAVQRDRDCLMRFQLLSEWNHKFIFNKF